MDRWGHPVSLFNSPETSCPGQPQSWSGLFCVWATSVTARIQAAEHPDYPFRMNEAVDRDLSKHDLPSAVLLGSTLFCVVLLVLAVGALVAQRFSH